MDVQDLRYAVEALDAGSFARAAKDLLVSRQALSQSVKRLERQLGTELFTVQGNNRLVPTAEGRDLLEDARGVVDAYDAFLRRHGLSLPVRPHRQVLTVAMATGAAISLPDGFLAAFRAASPDVVQEIEETNTEGALDLVGNGRADVALVGSHPAYLDGYEHVCVVPTGLWLAVPSENPLASKERLVLADLDGQTIVTAGTLNHLHRYLAAECERAGIRPNIPLTASNPELLVQLAQECSGLFFAFPPSIRPADNERQVSVLPLDTPEATRFGTYLVRRAGTRPSTAAQRFWDYARHAVTR